MKNLTCNIVPLNKSELKNINGGLGLIQLVFLAAIVYGYYDEKTKLK